MKRVFALLLCVLMIVPGASAHSGRTDGNGGHKDNKNASGLGSYHYHCNKSPPHLHTGGVCPYSKEYAVINKNKARMNDIAGAWEKNGKTFTENQRAECVALLCDVAMPFKLKAEWFTDNALYGVTTVKGVNIHKKADKSSAKVDAVAVSGSPLLLSGAAAKGWYAVRHADTSGVIAGYIMEDYVKLVGFEEYFALMYKLL